jgi:uncharacterized protein YqeY
MNPSTREQMRADLVTALKSGDAVAVSVLRNALASLSNAEAVDPGSRAALIRARMFNDVERRFLASDDVLSIVARQRDELLASAAVFDSIGRPAEAARCRAGAAILDGYLAA